MTLSRVFLVIGLIATGAVGGYAVMAGRPSLPALFLTIAAAVLVLGAWLLTKAAQAAVREPEATEVAVATGRRKKELEREKQLLLKALKELEFDHEMRKVSEADFLEIGGAYRARAVRVLRQLDEAGDDYRKLVEREVAQRLKTAGPAAASSVAAAAASAAVSPGCVGCGTINDGDADFCKKCGRRLRDEAAG